MTIRTQWTAPSVATLERSGILEKVDCSAETVRAVWNAQTLEALEGIALDAYEYADAHDYAGGLSLKRRKILMLENLLDMHGVEYLGRWRRSRDSVDYLNAGDTYAPTLLFTGSRMAVGCWGDLIETGAVVPYNQHTGECA